MPHEPHPKVSVASVEIQPPPNLRPQGKVMGALVITEWNVTAIDDEKKSFDELSGNRNLSGLFNKVSLVLVDLKGARIGHIIIS